MIKPGHKRTNPLIGTIKHIFGTNRTNNKYKISRKEVYYRNYPLIKRHAEGLERVANIEMCTKQDALTMFLDLAFSKYEAIKLNEWKEQQRIAMENNKKVKRTRFIRVVIQAAKSQGKDISKYF